MLSVAFLVLTVAPPPTTARLHVALVFDRGVTPRFAAAVAAEAARVWAAYGITLEGATVDDPHEAGVVTLRVSMEQRPRPGINQHALGSIVFRDGAPQPLISLYVGTAADLISTTGRGDPSGWPMALQDEMLTRVLGRALAHEIGHYVLQTRQHSASGLMRAVHPITELMEFRDGNLGLSSDDREVLCDALSGALAGNRG